MLMPLRYILKEIDREKNKEELFAEESDKFGWTNSQKRKKNWQQKFNN